MTGSGRIIFVNRFYWPDEPATGQLLADLAEALAARGYCITVIASRPETELSATTMRNGVEMVRVSGLRFGRRFAMLKALDFLSFSLAAGKQIRQRLQPGDTLVMMTDPPLLGAAVTRLALRRGGRIIHWIQDIYPEVATAVSGTRMPGLLRRWRDRAWREASHCIVPGEDMASIVRERGVSPEKTSICPNWAPAGLSPLPEAETGGLRQRWGLNGRFVVAYSGNLGRVHELHRLLDVADALREESGVVFLFIGDGAQKPSLEAAARNRRLHNVLFHHAQPRTQLGETLALGDLHLVTLREGCERLVFPSKLYGIAAVARPVLFIGPAGCELARLVTRHGFGTAHSAGEIQQITGTILGLRNDRQRLKTMGQAAAEFWRNQGRLDHAVKKWTSLLGQPKPLAATLSRLPQ